LGVKRAEMTSHCSPNCLTLSSKSRISASVHSLPVDGDGVGDGDGDVDFAGLDPKSGELIIKL